MSGDALADLILDLVAKHRAQNSEQVPLIGVSGAQGSGKTFVCRQIVATHPRIAHFSLDDVYFTQKERAQLVKRFHPLFATRGPPGTHAVGAALSVIAALRKAGSDDETPVPRFDKRLDDPAPEETWTRFRGRPDTILFDGWCVGALPDELGDAPLNALEAEEDPDGRWRAHVRADLGDRYQMFFEYFDDIVFLQSPSFEIVRQWRGQQEEEMLGRAMTGEERAKLDRFIMHYERITRSMLAGKHRANVTVRLDENRKVLSIANR
jgi:D-glycerate 3-kinase